MDNLSGTMRQVRQVRICTYLGLFCMHIKSFLHLPLSVRRRVYEEVGLIVGSDLVLRRRPQKPWYEKRNEEDDAYHSIYSLLQTCRAIHDEVQYILCTENRIIVSHESAEYGFYYLSKLQPRACSGLSDLYVHIYLEASPDAQAKNVTRSATLSRSRIDAWHTATAYLFRHVKPQSLRLYLICDAGDRDKSRAVLQPLYDHPGTLADCHIRLGPSRDRRIQPIAEEAAMQAKGLNPDLRKEPFRFFDLPVELRYRILMYTDLVTPWRQLQWNSEKGFHTSFGPYYKVEYHADLNASFEHAWQFRSCRSDHVETTGWFCSARSSSYSSHCQCWMPPAPLMLVSWSMYRLAIEVLYSCNRVIVMPDPDADFGNIGSQNLGERLAASRFMTRHIRPEVLSHLRSVELVFPGFDIDAFCPTPADPLFADWLSAVKHLKDHASLAAMTLIIHMRSWFGPSNNYVAVVDNRRPFERYLAAHRDDTGFVLRPHAAFLSPLKALREEGLQRLFVFLEWDWHWSPPRGLAAHAARLYRDGRFVGHRHDLEKIVDGMEIELERRVMGQTYDSSLVGKTKELPSQWMMEVE